MGTVEEILNYYSFWSLSETHKGEYQSVQDCMNHLSKLGTDLQLRTFLSIVKKFEQDGFLLKVGQKGDDPIYGATYVAQTLSSEYLKYGSYYFHFYGFRSIRNHFAKSVLPIDVTKKDDSKDIGTCFIIDAHRIITAKHCIEDKRNIGILDPMGQVVTPTSIWVPSDNTDLALIEMNYYNFSSCPKFELEYGEVLEEILTMGYPPIPGFDAVQVADLSHIGGSVKVSKGKIIAEERTLWDPEAFYLINARVKGGNSGGPIINNLGFVIGMVVNIPLNPEDQQKIDHLAYGVALTGRRIINFINDVNCNNDKVEKILFKTDKGGFSTSKEEFEDYAGSIKNNSRKPVDIIVTLNNKKLLS